MARISSYELTEWQAFESVEGPIGSRRDDYLAAMIAATVANALSEKEIPFSQFLPDWPELMRGSDDGDDP